MEPLFFALDAVLPLILLTALGYFLRRRGLVDGQLAEGLNKLVFHVFLPILLFINVYEVDGIKSINRSVSAFAAAGIFIAFLAGLWLALLFIPDRRQKGVFVQCVFRSNFSLLGVPLATMLLGAPGTQAVAVLSLFAIPINNILAVVALRLYGGKGKKLSGILLDIATNKLIIAMALGLIALCVRSAFESAGIAFRLKDIKFLYSALSGAGSVASPLSLISLGAMFTFSASRGMLRQIALATFMRILAVPAAMLTAAYLFFPSFRGASFAALIALFASPVAASSAIMASQMGGDDELAGQLVVWTTLLSAVTIFLFVYVFRALGMLG